MRPMIDIFIPSYHRPHNIKTVNFYLKLGYDPKKLHVFLDDETDDIDEYMKEADENGFQVHIFDMKDARKRYDYVHRASASRRSAGQARNTFQDFAKANGIDFYMVQDDDTQGYQVRDFEKNIALCHELSVIDDTFHAVEQFMRKHRIGLFGLSQTGDFYGDHSGKLYRKKVMNTTFYLMPYVYRGERGVQDDDTSLFTGVQNEGLFTGSFRNGLVLQQTLSATSSGGLTDLYNECKLLNKAMVCPIQFPTSIYGEKQKMNGGRLHHHINNRYLYPCIMRGKRNNIAWDTYPEDYPFTNEPKRPEDCNLNAE